MLYTFLPNDVYDVFPEFNLPGGTVDLIIRSREIPEGLVKLTYLIEIKRVPKSATDTQLEAKFEQAKEQVKKYCTGDYKEFRTVAICFRGNKDYSVCVTG